MPRGNKKGFFLEDRERNLVADALASYAQGMRDEAAKTKVPHVRSALENAAAEVEALANRFRGGTSDQQADSQEEAQEDETTNNGGRRRNRNAG